MKNIDLSASGKLPGDRIADYSVVVFADVGFYGISVLRGLFQNAHISYSRERHVERSRYRRCRKRQNVCIVAELLELFLVRNAETLFFVHYQKSEICKTDVFPQKLMGTYDHVYLSASELSYDLRRLIGA